MYSSVASTSVTETEIVMVSLTAIISGVVVMSPMDGIVAWKDMVSPPLDCLREVLFHSAYSYVRSSFITPPERPVIGVCYACG